MWLRDLLSDSYMHQRQTSDPDLAGLHPLDNVVADKAQGLRHSSQYLYTRAGIHSDVSEHRDVGVVQDLSRIAQPIW
jgi:hypothetical protein